MKSEIYDLGIAKRSHSAENNVDRTAEYFEIFNHAVSLGEDLRTTQK